MFVTDIMKQYVIVVTGSHVMDELKKLVMEIEPQFNFNGWGFDAGEGFYWCDKNGDLQFTGTSIAEIPDYLHIMRDTSLLGYVERAAQRKRAEDEQRLKEAKKALEEALNKHPAQENPTLTQIHIAFDGFTTHCVAKTKKGVVARSKSQAVGEDKENFDQLIGAMVAISKLVPEANRLDLLDNVLSVMGVGIQMPTEAKLVHIDEE